MKVQAVMTGHTLSDLLIYWFTCILQSLEDLDQLSLAEDDPAYVPIWDVNASADSRNYRTYPRAIEQAMRYGLSNR